MKVTATTFPMAPESQLRPLAVTVIEPRAGSFAWVLLERYGDQWKSVDKAKPQATRPTYREAMAEGLLVLQALVDDLDRGPRVERETKPDKQVSKERGDAAAASSDRAPTEPKPAKSAEGQRRLFGFGPLV